MATLHNVIETTKTILKWAGIAIGSIILIVLIYRGGLFIKETFFPTPPPPPTVLFGKLPKIPFPPSKQEIKLSFIIDTVNGKLPVFYDEKKRVRDRANVYKISHDELTLLDLQNTKNQVAKVGFGGGTHINENIYRFQKSESLQKTMDIDIVNKNFTISSAFAFNQNILENHSLPDPTSATDDTTEFLKSLGNFPGDIDTKKTKVQMLKLKNGILFDAADASEAHILRVDYFQKNVDTLPIYYPKGVYSTMNFLLGSRNTSVINIVQSEFYHQTILEKPATYPLKPMQKAYDELVEGNAYIAANFVEGNTIKIKDVLLGYFLTNIPQDYLIPIYVFKGKEDEFYAYVPAITDAWFVNPSPTP